MRAVIPKFNLDRFEERANRLQKKADRTGVEFDFEILYDEQTSTDIFVNDRTINVPAVPVEVEGIDDISIGDFEFLAKIEFLEDGNVLYPMDGVDEQMVKDKFGDTPATRCDHCGHKRQRKVAYILRKDGEEIQVGSGCLKDFTGHKSAERLAKFYEGQTEELRIKDGAPQFTIFKSPSDIETNFYRVKRVLALSAALIDKVGYKKSCRTNATKKSVRAIMNLPMDKLSDLERKVVQQESDYYERAQAIIDWATSTEDTDNTYLHNLKVLLDCETITEKQLGVVASAPTAYNRHQDRKEQKSRAEKSNWVGQEGERLEDIDAEVTSVQVKQSNGCGFRGGVYCIVKFYTDDDNILVWFTSSNPIFEVDESIGKHEDLHSRDKHIGLKYLTELDSVNIRATVKGHNNFKGSQQTKVSRVHFNSPEKA